jgi:hypothetical protein
MICLAVSTNGKHLTVAGDPDAMVQSIVASGTHLGDPPRPGFALSVCGATARGWVEWARQDLFPGDELVIRIAESSDPDEPRHVLSEAEFDDLADKKGVALARGEYASLKGRMRALERSYGDQLVDHETA